VYSLNGYGDMITDTLRMQAYVRALQGAVKPGAVVLDIGTGTGIFALLACRMGARRVYAIEPSDAIGVAREIAQANGCADRIEFIQGLSTDVTLPERADVIVSDLRGVLPFCGRHFFSIADARRRLLAPGGILIPQRDTLWAACVEAPELHAAVAKPWAENAFGLDMRAALKLVTNQWSRASLKPEQLMSAPARLGSIDYASVETPDFASTVTATVSRAGTGHGLCAWFDATLAEGIGFSNAPGAPEIIYGKAFFPWPEPVGLEAGDEVTMSLRADVVGDDYSLGWDTRITAAGAAPRSKAQFTQSSFHGEPLSPARLRKQSASHVPALNDDGRIDQLGLALMDAGQPLGEIAHELARRFPQRFARWEDALTRAGELATRYSR
jgi:protein arginine N-methyltransferase 1